MNKPIDIEDNKENRNVDREELRLVMQKLDRSHFDYLFEEKYYPKMLEVEGGVFQMGCDENRVQICEDNAKLHFQSLSDYKIAQYETTVWQFALYCAANTTLEIGNFLVSNWDNVGDNPIVNVNWYNAIDYATWVSEQKGLSPTIYGEDDRNFKLKEKETGYRLPTEAEWEYAAMGGRAKKEYLYSGDAILSNVGWYNINSDNRTQPVGKKKPNRLGIYDMSGNAREWCWDIYGEYIQRPKKDYKGVEEGRFGILRGGSYVYSKKNCENSYREWELKNIGLGDFGFRLASY